MFPTKKHLSSFQRSEKAGNNGICFNDAWNKQNFGLTHAQASLLRKVSNNIQGNSWVSFSDLQKAMNGEKIQGCRLTEEEIKKLFEAF